ncbi:MAG: DUF2279 domain-containing protein [Candidatus Kapaibacteriota bacterium]|jgi:hypothetical protein
MKFNNLIHIFTLIIFLFVIQNEKLFSEDITTDTLPILKYDLTEQQINSYKLYGLLGATIGTFAITQIYQYEDYWGKRNDFTVMDWKTEYDDALCADKFGHFYFTYGLTKLYTNGFQWTGMDEKSSTFYSSIIALSYQTYVEIQDGFSTGQPYLGFSRGDIIANFAGAIYPNLQVRYDYLKNYNMKISFNKSKNYDKIGYQNVTMDYESTYHWLSIDIYNQLSDESKKYWTPYINLAIGHSVKNIDRYGVGNHEVYLSLDWNLEPLREYYDKDNHLLNSILTFIGLYKLPAPAVKIYPNVVWYGLRL